LHSALVVDFELPLHQIHRCRACHAFMLHLSWTKVAVYSIKSIYVIGFLSEKGTEVPRREC
jgi:hypothetical protein